MTTTPKTASNHGQPARNKSELAEAAFARLLVDASRRGFHGAASITLVVQDGHIQHLRVSVEEMLK